MKTPRYFMIAFLAGPALAVLAQQGPIPFSAFDGNRDGVVSEQEFNQVHADRMATQAAQGRPMRNAANAPVFSDLDLDGNGTISQQELMQFQQAQMQARRTAPGWGRGRAQGMPCWKGVMPGNRGYNMPRYEEFDLNGDGTVLKDEFIKARDQRITQRVQQGRMMRGLASMLSFEDIDADGNGKLSREELAIHQQSHRYSRLQAR